MTTLNRKTITLAEGQYVQINSHPDGKTVMEAQMVNGRLRLAPGTPVRSGVDMLQPGPSDRPAS